MHIIGKITIISLSWNQHVFDSLVETSADTSLPLQRNRYCYYSVR